MKNIFIAIGGSGAKVADALVRLLAVGFPLTKDEQSLTSVNAGTMEVWVIDPDIDSAARAELSKTIGQYQHLTELLGDKWAMRIAADAPRVFNPLNLPGPNNQGKTLKALLSLGGDHSAEPFLHLYYTPRELEIEINRGFYQKPFIGSAVMAMFADSLTRSREQAGTQDIFNQLKTEDVRFFLCGSLHGGTGASGIPVMGEFLKASKGTGENVANWTVGACLLAPYVLPLGPPFEPLKDEEITEDLIKKKAEFFDVKNKASAPYRFAYESLGDSEKKQLIKQVLLGFFAKPEEISGRAHQAVLYYQNNVIKQKGTEGGAVFDDIYMIGKPRPIQLETWSNGGKSQINPLDSAEVAAALTALSFFSGASPAVGNDYVVAASTEGDPERDADRLTENMELRDLPLYGKDGFEPESAFLATASILHFVQHEIPWNVPARRWTGLDRLRRQYLSREGEHNKQSDAKAFNQATRIISALAKSLIDPMNTKGWRAETFRSLDQILTGRLAEMLEKRGVFDDSPKGSLGIGSAALTVSAFEVGKWFPNTASGSVSKGEYLRFLWSRAYECITQNVHAN
jgi:hypothetical protein